MRTLRVRVAGTEEGHGGEMISCTWTADSAFVLSAGWDGCLRLWLASNGRPVTFLQASEKPLSSCALSPDGRAWFTGCMDGTLSRWDAMTHQRRMTFLAHIRPISAIQYAPDGHCVATASWDRKIVLRKVGKERDGLALIGHSDIVAGCRWLPGGRTLLSWSHDGTLRLWDADSGFEAGQLIGHDNCVSAAGLSSDGHWAVSGARDGMVKLWDLRRRAETCSVQLENEVRGCWFLLDGQSVVTVNADGCLRLWSLPDLALQAELATGIKVMCGDLAPSGTDIALGSEDGRLHVIAIDGTQDAPILVNPTPTLKQKAGVIGRFLGVQRVQRSYQYTCPVCRHTAEIAKLPRQSIPCASCKRLLRLNQEVQQLSPA